MKSNPSLSLPNGRSLRLWVLVLSSLLLLGSCASNPDDASNSDEADDKASPLSSSVAELAKAKQESKEEDSQQSLVFRGDDYQIKLPEVREPIRFVGEDVSLNFEKAPLSEVMHAILSDILKLDYIVEKPVSGEVTLRTRTPIPRDQLLVVLESLLKANNVIMIRGADDRFLITGAQQGSRLSPALTSADSEGAGYSTVVIPLQYISAGAMAEILGPVADQQSFVRVDNLRNLLVMAGTRGQIDGWMNMVSTFDVDMLKGMSVGMFPLENAPVSEVSEALMGLLGQEGQDLNQLVRILPVERLNSLLVVTPRAHYLDTMSKWIERLDAEPATSIERRLYVYPVQNTTATRLAELLNNIYAGSGLDRSSGSRFGGGFQRDQGGVAPGLSQQTIGSGNTNSSGVSTGVSSSRRSGTTGAALGGFAIGSLVNNGEEHLLSDVRVVADEDNNALLVYSTGKKFKEIEAALKQLDVVATQVIIEASILEVSLEGSLEYGLEWSFRRGGGEGQSTGTALLVNGDAPTVPSVNVPGFSYSYTNAAGDITAILNALASDSLINVISTPSVMVLDNHTASILVGEEIPIRTDSSVSDGIATQSFSTRDTGVSLSVTPSVNAGGLVTMEVEQSVSEVGIRDSATGQNRFTEREINSIVAVRSGESVVLGGLISERATQGSSGVPFLHSIPILGALFGVDSTTTERTELLVIITPRVIYNEDELRQVSEEMRSGILHMELIEE